MRSRPDFRLYHSNALDVLAGLLARELRPPADPTATATETRAYGHALGGQTGTTAGKRRIGCGVN